MPMNITNSSQLAGARVYVAGHRGLAGSAILRRLERERCTTILTNVACGIDLSIRELAELIREVVGFTGQLRFDRSKPDGTARKLLDVSRMSELGWYVKIPLREGLEAVYSEYSAASLPLEDRRATSAQRNA
jgi:GDP-L-fucose synthase